MDYMALLLEIWRNHKGKIIGCIVGIAFAGWVIEYGLLVAIMIVLSISLGIFIGKKVDDKVDIKQSVEDLFKS